MKTTCFIIILFFALTACNNKNADQNNNHVEKTTNDTLQAEKKFERYHDSLLKTIPKDVKTVFGYRFLINGDFDGDGNTDTLIEHFISSKNGKETNKFYEDLDYNQLVALTLSKAPKSLVVSKNQKLDTLQITSDGQLFGLSYLKNEGDLNGDGSDEISYVVNWADWSNLNTCHLMTYKNKQWQELYAFDIWDWQLPDLPETFNQYGLFGLQDKVINSSNDTINELLTKQLNDFPGFITKLKKNKIQVRFRNEEASEDTVVVDLTKK